MSYKKSITTKKVTKMYTCVFLILNKGRKKRAKVLFEGYAFIL